MATTRTAPNGFMSTRSAAIGLSRAAFLGLRYVSGAPLTALGGHGIIEVPEAEGPGFVALWILSMGLVLAGGAFAGLTIAFMGQDGMYLKVLKDDIHETRGRRKSAENVLNLLYKGKHWVLVSLLLANVIVNESLPVVLDRVLGGGIEAIIGATILIVIFGEVVPQSICVRYGLTIGGLMSGPVLLLMWFTAPISWPIAKLLDRILGTHEGTVYKKSGLKTLVKLHQTMGEVSERLNTDEVTIIRAVLDLKAKAVGSVMTPMGDVFTLSADAVLNESLMDRILSAGYSRIPVHAPDNATNFIGMLLVKILITYDPEDCMQVKDFQLAALPETRPETSCLDILNYFQDGKSHMAVVSEAPGRDYGALGVVTLEDVIEELIGEEIVDESDVYIDVHKAIRRLTPAPTSMLFRRESQSPAPSGSATFSDHEGKRSSSLSAHGDGAASLSPKIVTFMMRQPSTGPDSEASTVPVKTNVGHLRQHLNRHLSPSNPAANPRSISSATITIKPGAGSAPAGSASRPSDHHLEDEAHDAAEGAIDDDEQTPLLGARAASLRTGEGRPFADSASYGSAGNVDADGIPHTPPGKVVEITTPGVILPSETSVARGHREVDGDEEPAVVPPQQPPATTKSQDSNGKDTSSASTPPAEPPLYRSSSITESYVNTGGVRKVVISTSSGDEEDQAATAKAEDGSEVVRGGNEEQEGSEQETHRSGEDDEGARQSEQGGADGGSGGQQQQQQGSKKKKSKGRKNKKR